MPIQETTNLFSPAIRFFQPMTAPSLNNADFENISSGAGVDLTNFQPKVAKKDLIIHKRNIKNGEVYFPPALSTLFKPENITLRPCGLLFITKYLQKLMDDSKAILEPSINIVKKDIEGNFIRNNILLEKKDIEKVSEINNLYTQILSTVWGWESASSAFNLTLPPASELETLLQDCTDQIENLKGQPTASPFVNVFFTNTQLNLYLITALTIFITTLFWLLCSTAIFAENIILAQAIMIVTLPLTMTASFLIGVSINLIFQHFEYYYRLPRALDRLNTKLNTIKNAFGIADTEFTEKKINILEARHKYLALNHVFIDPPPYEANQPVENQELPSGYEEAIRTFLQAETSFHNAIRKIAPKRFFFF